METIRIIALLGLLIFCFLIINKFIKQKKAGISTTKKLSSIKIRLRAIVLSCFFLLFLGQAIIQTIHLQFSPLPSILTKEKISSLPAGILGMLIIILSTLLLHFTLKAFKHSLRFGLDKNNCGKLVTNGIFAYTRNPFFISIEFLFIGFALIFANLFFVIIALLSIISIHFFILKEEQFMRENYGGEYNKYSKKVRRYF